MSSDPRLVVPYVTEQSPRGERTMDIYSRLLADRIVFLGTPVDDQVANVIMAQLLHLDAEDPEQDIHLYINSPGGSSSAMLAMYDTMQFVNADVATTALGMAASAGAFLLAAGAKGKRSALPNTRILLHQPSIQGLGGQASDVEIHARDHGPEAARERDPSRAHGPGIRENRTRHRPRLHTQLQGCGLVRRHR